MSDESLVVLPQQSRADIYAARNLTEAMQAATMLSKTKFVPPSFRGKPEEIFAVVQYGHELGLMPMQSLQSVALINDKPTVYGDGMLAVCVAHPCFDGIEETLDEDTMTATCVVRRRGWADPVMQTFSEADAKKAKLWGKSGPWTDYPKRMLQMRARGFALRTAFPDALKGVISAEEARDYPSTATVQLAGITTEALDALISKFGDASTVEALKATAGTMNVGLMDASEEQRVVARVAYMKRMQQLKTRPSDIQQAVDMVLEVFPGSTVEDREPGEEG